MKIHKHKPIMKFRGLGDFVHAVTNPIAAASDKIFKTDLENCGGCSKRREQWNRAVPFKTNKKP